MRNLLTLILLVSTLEAFTPTVRTITSIRQQSQATTTARSFGIDPTHFQDSLISLGNTFSSLTLADAEPVIEAAAEVAKTDNGWFGFLTGPIYFVLEFFHNMVAATGIANSWGISIIVLTVAIKAVTFPLTKTQLDSTNKMQAVAPAVKELQAKYQSNPEVMNQKVAEFYQVNEINPLAGCLPSFIQIPVFIGLYRAVLDLAQENKLDEPFLFLPSLEGPTYGADPASGSDWILKGWVDGAPSLGWDDTLAFLILPVFLVVSQFISMELMQPKTQDPAQQSSNAILKVLPLMIGWFSLNVPSALCVYWVVNNVVTTATTLAIRNMAPAPQIIVPGAGSTASIPPPPPTIFAPPREKPSGFAAASSIPSIINKDGVRPITTIDAEIVEQTSSSSSSASTTETVGESASTGSKKRSGKRKKSKN